MRAQAAVGAEQSGSPGAGRGGSGRASVVGPLRVRAALLSSGWEAGGSAGRGGARGGEADPRLAVEGPSLSCGFSAGWRRRSRGGHRLPPLLKERGSRLVRLPDRSPVTDRAGAAVVGTSEEVRFPVL